MKTAAKDALSTPRNRTDSGRFIPRVNIARLGQQFQRRMTLENDML
jgi:hypothetical protein